MIFSLGPALTAVVLDTNRQRTRRPAFSDRKGYCDLAGDATSFGLCAEKPAVITRILLCVLNNLAVRMCNRSRPRVLGMQRKVQILANALGAA